jgi:hypothetical protein
MARDDPYANARSPWKTYEVVEPASDGELRGVVSAALKRHSPQAQPAVAKMQRVEDIGWPEALQRMFVGKKKRKRAIVRPDEHDPPIWELKCTPHAWRLFFYTWENSNDGQDKRIIYLHADYKTTQRQDHAEVATARNRRGRDKPGSRAGHPRTKEFRWPE